MTWPIVELDEAQKTKLNVWLAKHAAVYCGAIGGRYVYSCCPTSIGQIIKVSDSVTGDEIDLSDYESW